MITDNQKNILNSLTQEIVQASWSCAAEQHLPRYEADQMDDFIKERKETKSKLRQIRENLEDLFTGEV